MRTGKLTTFTLHDGTEITVRSALEARWAIFFTELKLKWQYEPRRVDDYLPDFYVDGLGFVEVKPTLALFISESSNKVQRASRTNPDEKIYAFCGSNVTLDTVALYRGKQIFAPSNWWMIPVLNELLQVEGLTATMFISAAMQRANRAKLDHFVSVGKIIDLQGNHELSAKLRDELKK